MTEIRLDSIADLHSGVKRFIDSMKGRKIFAFRGEMGAGKTTFIAALCRELGVEDDVMNSPSFSIVNEYNTTGGETIYHFDCYRLEDESEALDIGVEDYFESGNLCLIEWPEMIEGLLPDETVDVIIKVDYADDSHTITIS